MLPPGVPVCYSQSSRSRRASEEDIRGALREQPPLRSCQVTTGVRSIKLYSSIEQVDNEVRSSRNVDLKVQGLAICRVDDAWIQNRTCNRHDSRHGTVTTVSDCRT